MRSLANRLSVAVLVCGLAAAPAAQAKDYMKALEKGEILCYAKKDKKQEHPQLVAKAVINAPPEEVWDLVRKCENYERTMVKVTEAKRLPSKGGKVICKVTVDVPFPYSDMTAVTASKHTATDGRWSRAWKLIRGDYKVNEGSWVLRRFKGDPDRTLAVYRARAVPKAWVPNWIRKMAQKKSIPNMFKKIRKQVED